MVVLKIDNSTSQIENLTVENHKRLKSVLSYTVNKGYHANRFGVQKQSLLDKKGNFPTGVLTQVVGWLEKNKVPHTLKDLRKSPTLAPKPLFNLQLDITPYPEQLEIAEAASKHARGTISAVTGFGKSIAMALVVQKLQLKTLIIVPNLELKRQLSASFLRYFGSLTNITIENIDSKSLIKHTDYDCLIIDEAHHVAAKTYRKLNKTAWNKIYYRFFFTATPFRSRNEEQILFESIAGQVIYRIDYHVAVEKGYVCPLEFYYVEIPRTNTNKTTYAGVYSDIVVNNPQYHNIVASIICSLRDGGKSVLCLVREIAHGRALSDLAKVMFANGQDEDSADMIKYFSQNAIKALIGTVGVLSEGVDTKPAEYVIIAGLGRSKPQFMQSCGRGIRTYPDKESCKIIIVKNMSHKYTARHFKEQCKIIKEEYNCLPVKITIDAT